MRIRRPIAALFTTLALLGGGSTLTACQAAGQDQNDGTTDDGGNQDSGDTQDDGDSDSDTDGDSDGGDQDDPAG
jgi:hypothetical protein